MGKGKSYEDVVTDIYALQKFTGRISLEPITALMNALDNPQDEFDAVHIAGTNGKGSTTTILAELLQAAGYTVGTYTSPHLTDFRERIKVNGEMIGEDAVADYYTQIDDTDVDISFFECTTALAYQHFAREDVDIAIVETGLGGRLDATNIITPELSVITNIAEDHTKWLGETPEQIAYEKAGIIAEGRPVVSGADGTPQSVIEQVAEQEDAALHTVETHAQPVDADSDALTVDVNGREIATNLVGDYQLENLNTALTACQRLDAFNVPDEAVENGLTTIDIPGRMEKLADNPLVLLDGAHNPAGMERAADTVERLQQGTTIAVVSIMDDKQYEAMLHHVERFADLIFLSAANIDRAADPEDLAEAIETTDYEIVADIQTTLEKSLQMADAEDTVVFTGSLYFVGDVKQTFDAMWYE